MSRSLNLAGVALVVLALGLPSCGRAAEENPRPPAREDNPQGEQSEELWKPLTLQDLEGKWIQDGSDHAVVFRLDGTYDAGADVPDFARDRVGTFEIEGSTIRFTNSGKRTRCEAGDRWLWERVELIGPGRLKAFIAKDECSADFGFEITLTRVSS